MITKERKTKIVEGEILLREGLIKFPEGPGDSPKLIGSKCSQCGDIAFPKKYLCGKCDSASLEEILLGPRAKLYTYTVVRQGVPGLNSPYILAHVKFPEDDELMVMAQMRDCPFEEVKIGMDLELVIDQVRVSMEGLKVIGYVFRPEREGES